MITGSGTVDIAAGTLTVGSTAGNFGGAFTGSGNLAKTGVGTFTLTGASPTFTGLLDIQGGTVALGVGGSFASAASLQLATGTILDLAGNSQAFAGVNGTDGTIAVG